MLQTTTILFFTAVFILNSNPVCIFLVQKIPTNQSKGMIGITFQHFVNLIPTQRPTFTQAGELGGEAEEKQTETWTEEEIPQGLPGIEKEVKQYL